ncbi:MULTISPECIES: S8 family serine peptidase [unclassified Microcoleus]|uniref:S8 family serine peptidase n=1 Tax=unclassified Microcoleus TaxID=2642155 RepID=UPI002FD6381E
MTNSVETKTETSPAGETQNPIVAENPNWATNPADSEIDAITGDKIETPVFFQPEKSETPTTPAAAADILTGEIENISPTPTDSLATPSESNETFGPLSDEEIALLWENLNRIWAATELNENSETSELEYINANEDTDSNNPTRLPFTPISQNYLPTDIENTADFELINGGDGEAETSESAQTAIISETATPTPANNQPETSQTTIPASATNSETNNNEYTVAQTDSFTETTADSPQPTKPLIGIIDTGFTANNPNINYSQIILGKDVIDGDSNPLIQPNTGNQHGDAILEIIRDSHNPSDTQKSSPIWLGRATGSGNWHQSLIEFVNAAIAAKQPNAVVNLSFDLTQINPDGTQTTRHFLTAEEKSALKYALDNNILIVAAAGNEGDLASALGQASTEFDNIITVGASENNNRSAYSSYGEGLDILAPTNTQKTAEQSTTETKQGTSIAAAFVTNTISQMWAANPSLNRQQIKNILLKTATDIDVPSWDERTGYGILNRELAIATAIETIPAIPVLAATKHLTKSLIDADANVSNSPNSTAKPSERPTATTAPGTPKTTSTSTGNSNEGTSSYTTELAPYTTTYTSSSNGTSTTNTQTNSHLSNTESSWDQNAVNTNSKSNSFNESTSDSSTNAATYTSKNFSQNSVENTNQSQQNYSRVKYEGTRNDQSSYLQKSRSSSNYTSPEQTTNTTADSYRNSFSQSDSQYGTDYAINNGNRQDDWGSKSTSNTHYTSSTGSSLNNSSTQIQGKADWTNSSNNSSYTNTHSGEESQVNRSNYESSSSSGFYKNGNSIDNYSVINSTWDSTTTDGKTVGSNSRDTYSEANSNYHSSYDDGQSKNTSNQSTYTVNQSQQTNSSNGPSYWHNNRNNNYSVSQGRDTQSYENGPSTSSHNRDTYSLSKSNSSSSNSQGKVSYNSELENYSENHAQWESEYKADTYTTQSNSDESTITATKSNSSTEGNNSTSSNSSDTSRTWNSQTVTTYKDGQRTENGSSSYEKWSSESSSDSKGVASSVSKYSSWSSSYSKYYFKGGYSWTETVSGYDSESVTKEGVSTSNGSSWSWTRSGTEYDDGRNSWSESWSKSSWKNGEYLPGEYEVTRGSFDPEGTQTQTNNLPEFGEAPRLNKAPKQDVPPDLMKPPKPSDDIWQLPTVIFKDAASKNASEDKTFLLPTDIYKELESQKVINRDGYFNASSPKNESPWDKFLAKLRRFVQRLLELSQQGKQAVLEFLGALLYYYLKNNGALLQPFTDLLIPGGAKARDKLEKLLQKSQAAQAGRATADLIGILQGIAEILFGAGGSIGGGLTGNPALVAAGLGALAHGISLVGVSVQDLSNLIVQVLQSNSGNNPWDDVPDEDLEEFLNPAYEYINTRSWHPGSEATPEISVKKHFRDHGAEVGANNVEEYIQLAEDFKQVVLNDKTTQIRRISGATSNVSRYELGDKYIDLVDLDQGRYGIISFGKLWHR